MPKRSVCVFNLLQIRPTESDVKYRIFCEEKKNKILCTVLYNSLNKLEQQPTWLTKDRLKWKKDNSREDLRKLKKKTMRRSPW